MVHVTVNCLYTMSQKRIPTFSSNLSKHYMIIVLLQPFEIGHFAVPLWFKVNKVCHYIWDLCLSTFTFECHQRIRWKST